MESQHKLLYRGVIEGPWPLWIPEQNLLSDNKTFPPAKSGSMLNTAPLSKRASRVCWIGKPVVL